jgi:hypothetical protein
MPITEQRDDVHTVPGRLKIIRSRMFLEAGWLVLLMIYLAVSPVGNGKGAGESAPHSQEINNLYLPFVIFREETRTYLPAIFHKIVPDIANPGFEQGYTGWAFSSNQGSDLITQAQAHIGVYSASLGNGNNYRVASISQGVTVPASRSSLIFWIYIDSADACGWDYLRFYINSQLFYTYDICSPTSTHQWSIRNLDFSGFAGQPITLKIEFTSDVTVESYVYVDDFEFGAP